MKKLTELDRKILYELDKDGGVSFSDIARTVGTTPQVVKYHYHRFLDENIIKNFWAFIDYDKAGYPIFWGYWLKFRGLSKEKEEELYSFIKKSENFPIIMRSDGYADAMVGIIARNVFAHNKILQDFLSRFGNYVIMNDMVVGISFVKFPRSYLIGTENTEGIFEVSGGITEQMKLSSVDRRILSILQTDGRAKLSRVAEKMNVSRSLIYKRHEQLIKRGIITKTTFTFNHQLIGMKLYRNLFKIIEINKEESDKFYAFCLKHPNINNYVKIMGQWQIMIDFEVESSAHMRDILRTMKYQFKDTIQEIAVNEIYQIDKFSQMKIEYPELANQFRSDLN